MQGAQGSVAFAAEESSDLPCTVVVVDGEGSDSRGVLVQLALRLVADAANATLLSQHGVVALVREAVSSSQLLPACPLRLGEERHLFLLRGLPLLVLVRLVPPDGRRESLQARFAQQPWWIIPFLPAPDTAAGELRVRRVGQ